MLTHGACAPLCTSQQGALPRGLLALPRLRALALRGCRLGGPLPEPTDGAQPEIAVDDAAAASAAAASASAAAPLLEWLDLSDNQYTGSIPVRAQ